MNTPTAAIPWPRKIGISILLLICGLLVFVFGSNYFTVFPTNESQLHRGLAAASLMRCKEETKPYGYIAYAFLIGMFVIFMTSLTVGLRDSLLASIPVGTARHLALAKLRLRPPLWPDIPKGDRGTYPRVCFS